MAGTDLGILQDAHEPFVLEDLRGLTITGQIARFCLARTHLRHISNESSVVPAIGPMIEARRGAQRGQLLAS